jgi:PAS domain S-box-containing protein
MSSHGGSAARTAELLDATGRLAAALTAEAVSETLLEVSDEVFAAASAVVYVANDRGEQTLLGWRGADDVKARWPVLTATSPVPLAEAIENRQPIWLEDHLAAIDRYPNLARSPVQFQASAALPLLHGDRVVGGFALGFAAVHHFDKPEREALRTLASQAAVAIERARLFRVTREAEESHRRLVAELSETLRLNELLAGVLAHDLRNPLNAILMAAQLAGFRDKEGRMAKPLERIMTSGERMGRMVSQLLDFTRIRLGRGMPLDWKACDLDAVIQHVVDELESGRPQSSIAIERTGDTRGAWDEDRLGQLFSNLAGNALEHGGGEVKVQIDGTDIRRISVSIHNSGVIPAALLPRLFEPLVGREHRSKGQGLGLGLFIAEHIARSHGGGITVESNEAEGTTFRVSLPREPPVVKPRETAPLKGVRDDARFRLLVESVKDYAIFLLDPDGRIQTWTAGAELIKGYRADEIVGQHISVFYTPEDRLAGKPQTLLGAAARLGRVEDESWRVRKDGSRFWADVVITALRDGAGGLTGFAKVTRDLSARKRAEEDLRRSEQRVRLIVDSIKDYAICVLDPRGLVSSWNSGAERTMGYTASEILGKHLSTFYSPEDVAAGKCDDELDIAERDGRFEDEGWRVRKDGTTFWANVIITALRNDAGVLVGFAQVTRDLTARRKLEEERIRVAQANEAIRLRDEFLAIASHELKTPLTGLQMQLEALGGHLGGSDPKVARHIVRASRSGDRLAELVESLLDVSRLSQGELELHRERFDLAAVVGDLAESTAEVAAKSGSRIISRIPASVPGSWDRPRIAQVVTNLLENAIKYGCGQPIEVSLVARDGDAVLEVRDHGPGIPGEDFARLFERFERAGSIRHHGGLGLGLYLVREIVAAHGGSVAAANAASGGACFTVHLPVEAAA